MEINRPKKGRKYVYVLDFEDGRVYRYDVWLNDSEEIEDYFLPDPSTTKLDGAQQLIDLILAHPVAVVEPNVTGIKLGSLVTCEFNEGPGNLGKQRGLKVVGSLATSDQEEYADLIMKKLLAAPLLIVVTVN